jgi:hypothetical protein
MKITHPKTQQLFSQAYILGGSPCSGKSTIAKRLSRQYQMQYYKVDDHENAHARKVQPDRHPVMDRYSKMNWEQIWMRPVALQVKEELAYYRERFELIVQDLSKYDPGKSLILEGAAYLPELLQQNQANPERVLFLVPTRAFQIHHYRQRGWIQPILNACSDPVQAFDNWMMRDYHFGQAILQQAKDRNYATLVVDGKQDMDAQYAHVRVFFGLT